MRLGNLFKDSSLGSQRIIRKFLWFPVTIDFQTRWLEWARIRQMCKSLGEEYGYYWQDMEWIDDDEMPMCQGCPYKKEHERNRLAKAK